jgi:hypothetical protein
MCYLKRSAMQVISSLIGKIYLASFLHENFDFGIHRFIKKIVGQYH